MDPHPQTGPRTGPRTRPQTESRAGPPTGAEAGSPIGVGSERLAGVVERITFHSPESGWSVLQVSPFGAPHTRVSVIVHQAKVFAGATMEFEGSWRQHPRYGEQFDATRAVERKPASAAALEKYLGSGLIRGVGPRTARKIVAHFGAQTLGIFEDEIERLVEVRGIARRKLDSISEAWREHQAIRHVMMFLQEHGISTLFAVRIYKTYGDAAIEIVREDPYRLARDIYGIGFFSADRIAASLGCDPTGVTRLDAGIRHVLSASREEGHCFLTAEQVEARALELLELLGLGDAEPMALRVREALEALVERGEVRIRRLARSAFGRDPGSSEVTHVSDEPMLDSREQSTAGRGDTPEADVVCYYARSLYRDEETVAREIAGRIRDLSPAAPAAPAASPASPAADASDAATPFTPVTAAAAARGVDVDRVARWIDAHSQRAGIVLSASQRQAVLGIATQRFSVLTGGPGCGKTTTTRTVVRLARAMGKRVVLAAPTGRAAQRMKEVIGIEARTIHRLLEWSPVKAGFSRDAEHPIPADFVVVDETSMLDVSLAASLLVAVPPAAQILFVGDPDQLPSVGPGQVLADLLRTPGVPRFELREIFRQAEASQIVRFAHAIQQGQMPVIPSPLARPEVWQQKLDCLFVDGEEATQEQIRFLRRARAVIERTRSDRRSRDLVSDGRIVGRLEVESESLRVSTSPHAPPGEGDGKGQIDSGVGADVGSAGSVRDVEANIEGEGEREGEGASEISAAGEPFSIPRRFLRVDLERLAESERGIDDIRAVLDRVHPHSVLRHGLSLADAVRRLYTKTIPERLGRDCEIQILTPMNRGSLGATALNRMIQDAVTPARPGRAEIRLGERVFRVGDRVIQRRNDYDLGVHNGDIGRIVAADGLEMSCQVEFGPGPGSGSEPGSRSGSEPGPGTGTKAGAETGKGLETSTGGDTEVQRVTYTQADLAQLALAYAITVHKSQGSEFDVVILPLVAQHHRMLFRGLVYTGLTRARRLALFVGERRALALAVRNAEGVSRQTALRERIHELRDGP